MRKSELLAIKAREYERGLADAKVTISERDVEEWADKFDGFAQQGLIIDIDLIREMLIEIGVEIVSSQEVDKHGR